MFLFKCISFLKKSFLFLSLICKKMDVGQYLESIIFLESRERINIYVSQSEANTAHKKRNQNFSGSEASIRYILSYVVLKKKN